MDYIIVSMSLSKEKIRFHLNPASCTSVGEIHCFDEIDSTNRWLLDEARRGRVHNQVCIAQSQTSGVGRNGKPWFAGNSDNILMSLAHVFDLPPAELAGLSLAVGIAIANALEALGVDKISLKWPNDVYLDGRKLAGILIQSQGSATGSGQSVIVGIGLNIRIDSEDKKTINQPIAELARIGLDVDQRERIIARLLDELFVALRQFGEAGLKNLLPRWDELDFLKGRDVVLNQGDQTVSGRYLGVNHQGAIRIALENNQIKEYYVGELSVRAVD